MVFNESWDVWTSNMMEHVDVRGGPNVYRPLTDGEVRRLQVNFGMRMCVVYPHRSSSGAVVGPYPYVLVMVSGVRHKTVMATLVDYTRLALNQTINYLFKTHVPRIYQTSRSHHSLKTLISKDCSVSLCHLF